MSKIVSKKNKRYTLMIIPHAKEKVSKWQIPLWLIRMLWGLVICVFLVIIYFAASYQQMADEVREMELVKKEAREQLGYIFQLEEKVEELNEETRSMQEKLVQVKELESVVREMVGLEQKKEQGEEAYEVRVQAFSASRGGSLDSEIVRENLGNIDQSIQSTTLELGQLVDDVAKRLEYLEAVPSRMPVKGRVSSGFGYRRSPFGGGREFHNGIDIAAARGTQVKAAGKGKVVFAGWRAGFGQTVIIDHGYGFKTWYGHNSSLAVKNGQWVEAEQLIARVGSTGRSTGPHVHFTVEVKGKAVNPYNYLN